MENKKVFQTLVFIPLVVASATLFCRTTQAAPVTVKAYAVHVGQDIQYHYQVTNLTKARRISSVSIGNRGDQGNDPATITNEEPELSVYPTGSYWGPPGTVGDSRGEQPRLGGTFSSPQGWEAYILEYEETTRFSVDWGGEIQTNHSMPPGQTLNFSVMVPKRSNFFGNLFTSGDPAYLKGHFTVGFLAGKSTDEGPAHWNYTGQIESLDTIPPALNLTVNPTRLQVTAGKLVTVTATVTTTDNYDPQPEIKLESITANEPITTGDIAGAALGTNDRQFQLRDVKVPRGATGRIYTITYSATDASGNRATASATVSVK